VYQIHPLVIGLERIWIESIDVKEKTLHLGGLIDKLKGQLIVWDI